MIIAAIVFAMIFCLWLSPDNGEVLNITAFLLGAGVNVACIYINVVASVTGSYRNIIEACKGKSELINYSFQTATIIGTF